MDIRSFSINYELNAVLYSDRLAKELEQAFEQDLVHCSEFNLAEYQSRNVATPRRSDAKRNAGCCGCLAKS
jgi:cardiolipin synthase